MSAELQRRGFGNSGSGNPQNAAENVGYGSYDRIGCGSGKSDSYAEKYTNTRLAGQGSGKKYIADKDTGDLVRTHDVSGQSVVDANQLTKQKYDPTHKIPEDATGVPPSEIPSVLKQQNKAIGNHPDDPLVVAKAVDRAQKMARTVNESVGDARLTQAAREIYDNPGRMDEGLKQYGFVDAHGNPDPSAFCAQGGGAVGEYSETFKNIHPEPKPPKS